MNESNSSESYEEMHKMQDLLEEILEIQKSNQNVDKSMVRVQSIVNESSKLIENSTSPAKIMVDAKILHVGSNFFNSNVSSLSTNLTSFSEEKYVSEILNHVENCSEVVQSGQEWKSLAPFTYHLLKKSNPVTFMLGPLSLQALTPNEAHKKEEKQKVERHKKISQNEKTILTCVMEKEKPEDEGSDVYEHIFKCLVKHYKKNNKQPVCYFNFVIDPTDYWKTVENIFHFAFLVRDGNVKMSLQNGVPFVEPVFKKCDEALPKSQNNQFCLSLSMSDWKNLIEKFQVKSSCIPPFGKKL